MLALARFSMRGPLQASLVAAIATALPLLFWIGAAVVALVILRLGVTQGLNIGLWALLPALGWGWVAQDPTAVTVLLQSAIMAMVLRASRAWEAALVTGSGLAILTGLALPALYPELIGQLAKAGVGYIEQYNPEMATELGNELDSLVREVMNASMAGTYLLVSVGVLMLARSWQAGLFNPGGFQKEFHAFRLSRPVAGLCGLAVLGGPFLGLAPLMVSWAGALPLIMAGLGLIHGIVSRRQLGVHWLVLFYVLLVLLSPSLMLLLLVIAFVDSWLDFRRRIKPREPAE
ncbi:hypothetical protein CF392_02185 [Tamilnaduibacter salinus]|uniref:DUF2232 domain-containing protein n=1 Tax=Tamilnaduibacter salinus TaxID=1484056 RepID=A0A2A2I6B3_9GAMM|nr:hypothetical protein [Tamilnaduibacter salinus]PAV27279.1 hypothetical protein CF392_02185 [Tamilnaduibacter salinus]